jgi:hypothetical protein
MNINRVMLATGTGPNSATTDSPVHVRITNQDGSLVVDHTIPDTPQEDFEHFKGNVYFIPVISPFRRSQLTDASVELSIQGDDAWLPRVVILFGLDTGSGQPNEIVPLVHIHPWPFGALSTDLSEGVPSVILPLAPMDT